MKNGESELYNADTPDDARKQAINQAERDTYEYRGDDAWVRVVDVTVDKVELL
jgi:hypothetical protein